MKQLKKTLKIPYLLMAMLFLAAGCADLAVENKNSPTTEDVLSDPSDVESLVQGGFVSWWQAGTALYMGGVRVGADVYTSSYGNFDMRNQGEEPRIPYNNSPTAGSGSKNVTERPWYSNYGVLADANDFLNVLNSQDGFVIPSTETGTSDEDYTTMVEAAAYLLQGLTLGDIGLYFDQAFIFDENTDLSSLELVPYTDVLAAADAKLQLAKTTASGLSGVTLGDNYINGYNDMDMATEFVELVNSLRARYMVLGARNPAETDAVDWNSVKGLAEDGLTYDFSPEGDDNFWYNYIMLFTDAELGNWIRVDQRIVNLMDPSQPAAYPEDGTILGEASSDDARLESDFVYFASVPFPPDRGLWFFGNYSPDRYPEMSFYNPPGTLGPMPHILKAENDLMYAEAVSRTNSTAEYSAAAQAINNTRVDRGTLDPITVADFATTAAMDAIRYEREIEMFQSGFMYAYGDRRRFGELQSGTPEHFPVPAEELLLLQEVLYTFGGESNAGDPGTAPKLSNNPFDIPLVPVDDIRPDTKF